MRKIRLMKCVFLTTFLGLLMMTAACSTNQLNVAAKSIITAQGIYDATMRACAEAHAKGLIDDAAKAEIIGIGNMAHDSIVLAQAALIAFVDASTAENQSKLTAAISSVRDNLGMLVEAAIGFGVRLSSTVTNYTGGGNE